MITKKENQESAQRCWQTKRERREIRKRAARYRAKVTTTTTSLRWRRFRLQLSRDHHHRFDGGDERPGTSPGARDGGATGAKLTHTTQHRRLQRSNKNNHNKHRSKLWRPRQPKLGAALRLRPARRTVGQDWAPDGGASVGEPPELASPILLLFPGGRGSRRRIVLPLTPAPSASLFFSPVPRKPVLRESSYPRWGNISRAPRKTPAQAVSTP